MVDYEAGAVGGEDDVELGKEGDDGGGDGVLGGEGDEDIAVCVYEVDELVRCQVGSEAWLAVLVG